MRRRNTAIGSSFDASARAVLRLGDRLGRGHLGKRHVGAGAGDVGEFARLDDPLPPLHVGIDQGKPLDLQDAFEQRQQRLLGDLRRGL